MSNQNGSALLFVEDMCIYLCIESTHTHITDMGNACQPQAKPENKISSSTATEPDSSQRDTDEQPPPYTKSIVTISEVRAIFADPGVKTLVISINDPTYCSGDAFIAVVKMRSRYDGKVNTVTVEHMHVTCNCYLRPPHLVGNNGDPITSTTIVDATRTYVLSQYHNIDFTKPVGKQYK